MKIKLILILLVFASFKVKSQDSTLNKIVRYLDEFKQEAKKDNSKLWGISFDVPIIVATSDYIVTNRKIEGFSAYKNIYYGKAEEIEFGGHGRKTWKGQDWAFYSYPFSGYETKKKRQDLFFHEAFHRNQPFIGLDGKWTQCKHLNSSEARSLLKLEYNALLKALKETNFEVYLTDALTFRAYRYYLYPNAYIEEQEIEMLEGLAEYTGLKLGGYFTDEIYDILQKRMSFNPQMFAYFSGAIYGFILDKSERNWQKEIKQNDNFLYFTQKTFDLKLPNNIKSHIEKIRNDYNWQQISSDERKSTHDIKEKEKKYTKLFLKKEVVKIELKQVKGFVFKSSIIFPFESGKVYNGVSANGDWGKLVAKDEIYIGDALYLPTPFTIKNKQINGNGWILYLNNNWTISKTDKNYYQLVKQSN